MPIKDPEARKLYNKQYFQSRKNNKPIVTKGKGISKPYFTEQSSQGFVMPSKKEYKDPHPLKRSVEPIVYNDDEEDDEGDDDFAEFKDDDEEPLKLMKLEDFVKQLLSEQEQDEYLFGTDDQNNLCFRGDPLFLTNEFSKVLQQNNHDFQETLEHLGYSLILYVEKFDRHYKEIAELCFKKYNKIKSGLKDF